MIDEIDDAPHLDSSVREVGGNPSLVLEYFELPKAASWLGF